MLSQHSSFEECILADPDVVARGYKVCRDFYKLQRQGQHRNQPREVTWIFGVAGTGKSQLAEAYARSKYGDGYFVHPPGNLKWWGSYSGQRCVVINDFRYRDVREAGGLGYLLNILDRYDIEVEIKGGFVYGDWDECIITSAYSPVGAFTYHKDGDDIVEENLGQLIRRLGRIIELVVEDGAVREKDRTEGFKGQFGCGSFIPLIRSDILGIRLRQDDGSVLPLELGRVEPGSQ